MEELGTVIRTEGNIARVRIVRHSACSKCEKKCGLAQSHEQDELIVEIDNKIGATRGEQVILEMKERNILLASLLVYLLPLIFMISGYFLVNSFAKDWGFKSGEIPGIIGSLVFLFLSFLSLKLINPFLEEKSGFKPVIKKVIK